MSTSPYQDTTFFQREKKILEGLPDVKYLASLREMDLNGPLILITNTHTKPEEISPELLEKTVLMIHPNSGHDNYPVDFVKKTNFPIILGNPIRSHAVFEYCLSCIFQHFAPIPNHQHWSESRVWDRSLLRDQKVLILGHGHIGKLLSRTLKTLCQSVEVIDPFQTNDLHIHKNLQEEHLKDVNILICATSLNESSHHMIQSEELKLLASDALIINPARGGIIKEEDLVHFLQRNPNAKAYLDVFEAEPFKPGEYNQYPNLNKTSHIAGVHKKLNKDIISFEYLVLKDFIEHYHKQELEDFKKQYQDCILSEELFNGITQL